MKNKGFTLIELLAVILILGIIALIAIPTVSKMIDEARMNSFKITAQNIEKVIEQKCQMEIMKNKEVTRLYTFNNGIPSDEINMSGDLPDTGSIIVDNQCNIAYKLSNKKYCAIKNTTDGKIEIQKGSCDYNVYFAETIINDHKNDSSLKDDTYDTNLLKEDSETNNYYEKKSKHPYVSKKYFVGENPNNLLLFANSCWSIINITQNNSVKIIYEGPANGTTCNNVRNLSSGKIDMSTNKELNRWADYKGTKEKCMWSNWNDEETVIRKYLEKNDFIPFTTNELNKIANATWYTGFIFDDPKADGTKNDIKQARIGNPTYLKEKPNYYALNENEEYIYTGKFGLFSPDDFLKINCMQTSSTSKDEVCSVNNYMKKNYDYWSINSAEEGYTWHYMFKRAMNIECVESIHELFQPSYRVAAYINNSQMVESGNGSPGTPYILK